MIQRKKSVPEAVLALPKQLVKPTSNKPPMMRYIQATDQLLMVNITVNFNSQLSILKDELLPHKHQRQLP